MTVAELIAPSRRSRATAAPKEQAMSPEIAKLTEARTLSCYRPAAMTSSVFEGFCRLVHERSGISLAEGKEALVSTRVGRRMRSLGIADACEYLDYVRQDTSGEEIVLLLDAITTNVTSFFREPSHFEIVRRHFLQWLEGGQTRFRFWSAACSTGEEPYSLAITLSDAAQGRPVDWKILGTDISTRVLERCRRGEYSSELLRNVPPPQRDQHFQKRRNGKDTIYQASVALRERMVFNRLNLSQPPFPMTGPLDVIFCRNVMIYFDRRVRQTLVDAMYRLVRPGGLVIIGHSESLMDIDTPLRRIEPSVYVK